ncbi:peptidase inhibitor family I36 protein [Streptomyces gamaensis]|uniref:Peptidase inhibitor family I36 protein n=1 Tax=Streptomyces gamaensis TaxID=1763542 RepID=A0ABW0Z318_9ACTN
MEGNKLMNFRTPLTLATAAVALGTGLAVAAPAAEAGQSAPRTSAASTQAAPGDCPRQYLCAYPQNNYGGGAGPVKDNNTDLRKYPKFRHVQSLFNNGTRCGVYLFSQPNYGGVKHSLARGDGYPNLNNIPEYRTTGVQSNRWCG